MDEEVLKALQLIIFTSVLHDDLEVATRYLAQLSTDDAYMLAERTQRLYVLASGRAEE